MVGSAVQLVGLVGDRKIDEARVGLRLEPDAKLDLVAPHRVGDIWPWRHVEPDLDLGKPAVKVREDAAYVRQQRQVGDHAQRHRAGEFLFARAACFRNGANRAVHAVAQLEQALTERGQADAAAAAHAQWLADQVLQPSQRGADARLLAVERARSRADAAAARNLAEGLEQVPIEFAGKYGARVRDGAMLDHCDLTEALDLLSSKNRATGR